jgi:hypothetical protein
MGRRCFGMLSHRDLFAIIAMGHHPYSFRQSSARGVTSPIEGCRLSRTAAGAGPHVRHVVIAVTIIPGFYFHHIIYRGYLGLGPSMAATREAC